MGGKQPEIVHGVATVSGDRQIMGHADHNAVVDPLLLVIALGVANPIDRTIKWDGDCAIMAGDVERRSAALPAIRLLVLIAVHDLLGKESVFVVDAVSEAGHAKSRKRFEKTGGEASEATVAEAGIELL